MQDPVTVSTILGAVNTIGTVGILVVLFVLFYRGDLMSRKTYTELTEHVLKELCRQIGDQIDKVLIRLNERKEAEK